MYLMKNHKTSSELKQRQEAIFTLSGKYISFNQPLNSWNMRSAITIKAMLGGTSFNHPLNNWDLSNVNFDFNSHPGLPRFRHVFGDMPYAHYDSLPSILTTCTLPNGEALAYGRKKSLYIDHVASFQAECESPYRTMGWGNRIEFTCNAQNQFSPEQNQYLFAKRLMTRTDKTLHNSCTPIFKNYETIANSNTFVGINIGQTKAFKKGRKYYGLTFHSFVRNSNNKIVAADVTVTVLNMGDPNGFLSTRSRTRLRENLITYFKDVEFQPNNNKTRIRFKLLD
jgi:hypothetical protein